MILQSISNWIWGRRLAKCRASGHKLTICRDQERSVSQLCSPSQFQMLRTQLAEHAGRCANASPCSQMITSQLVLPFLALASLFCNQTSYSYAAFPCSACLSPPPSLPHGHRWSRCCGSPPAGMDWAEQRREGDEQPEAIESCLSAVGHSHDRPWGEWRSSWACSPSQLQASGPEFQQRLIYFN